MNALDRIKQIGERWFLTEPLLFAVYCSHEFCENDSLDVAVRTGNRRVEYAPHILDKVSNADLLEYLKVEMFRILLKHPYQRQPPFAIKSLLTQASNITIADVYDIAPVVKAELSGTELNLPQGLCFEEYYNLLLQQTSSSSGNDQKSENGGGESGQQGAGDANNAGGNSGQQGGDGDGSSGGNSGQKGSEGASSGDGSGELGQQGGNSRGGTGSNGDSQGNGGGSQGNSDGSKGNCGGAQSQQKQRDSQTSELWEDDAEACCDINGFIEKAVSSNTWGTIPGTLKALIKASLKVDLDYRKMLSLFKTSVLSSRRRLTRMRPNRRFGFDAMGSRYELSTNLLIAVDVSGSVTDKSLQFFFSVINRLFKYGIEKLDVLQFDATIQGNIEPLKKARRTVKILGRGGTCFQPVADYYCEHPEYDGLIYFSDGYAPPPVYNTKRPIDVLWVLCSKSAYEANGNILKELKRNRVTYIPRSE